MRSTAAALAIGILLLAGAALVAHGYASDSGLAFFGGLGLLAAALGPGALALGRARLPAGVFGLCLGLFFLLGFFAVAEGAWWAYDALVRPREPLPFYTYEAARRDPEGFRRRVSLAHEGFPRNKLITADPRGENPYVLVPGASLTRHHSTIRINSLGFRGEEIARDKGSHFRIVAIGESTTFGLTFLESDRTWPEALAHHIRSRLACGAPVEVINAGVPGWTLANQLKRLPHDVLPLDPDLILAYHGINGFHHFFRQLPELTVRRSPLASSRPSRMLQRLENAVRVGWFRRRYRASHAINASVLDVEVLNTPYAQFYAALVRAARVEGADVALSTFNLAVNDESPEEVIRFYETIMPDLRARMLANRLHSRLVRELGRRLGVIAIDTSEGLDGAYREAFVDVAHFTQEGRERLAENIFEGLRDYLASHPRLRCRPAAGSAGGRANAAPAPPPV